jgi:hypothetical protein
MFCQPEKPLCSSHLPLYVRPHQMLDTCHRSQQLVLAPVTMPYPDEKELVSRRGIAQNLEVLFPIRLCVTFYILQKTMISLSTQNLLRRIGWNTEPFSIGRSNNNKKLRDSSLGTLLHRSSPSKPGFHYCSCPARMSCNNQSLTGRIDNFQWV